jgi:DNA-directed RNA polymerase specialized sigma24 family protein
VRIHPGRPGVFSYVQVDPMTVTTEHERALGDRMRRGASSAIRPWRHDGLDDEYAWFFRAEFPSVVGTAYLILRDRGRAEEVAQDAFMRLHVHWKKVSRYERPDAWVRRVAIRLASRIAERERRRPLLEAGPASLGGHEGPGADLDVTRAVAELPMRQRVAVVLFYLEDRPLPEVAHILDCSTGAAKTLLHRARARLARRLGEEVSDVD